MNLVKRIWTLRRCGLFPQRSARLLLSVGALLSAAPWAASAQPQWEVDVRARRDVPGTTADANVLFTHPTGATHLSNGDLAIATGARGSVVFVKKDGTVRRLVHFGVDDTTRSIHSTSWLQACGRDSLFVLDHLPGRITVLNRRGDAVREFQLPGDWMMPACSTNGQLAIVARFEAPPPATSSVSAVVEVPIHLVDRGGFLVGSLPRRALFALRYARQSWWTEPLGTSTSVAIGTGYVAVLDHVHGRLSSTQQEARIYGASW